MYKGTATYIDNDIDIYFELTKIKLPKSVGVYIYIYIRIYKIKYIYDTCAWTPNNVFLSMVVVESLSSKLEWVLAQVFAISIPCPSHGISQKQCIIVCS